MRVGVVLPSDQMRNLCLSVPAPTYQIFLDARPGDICPAGPVEVVCEGQRVRLHSSGFASEPAGVLALTPLRDLPLQRGAGIEARNLLAGRGFHWQKRANFTLPGTLEFRIQDDCLLAVNELPLEPYLTCVATSEMSGACPLEFLKAQVLAARSWVLAHTEEKHSGLPIDRCNDDCCQRYQGTTFLTPTAVQAVDATCGQVIFHSSGRIVDANYSKSCGGIIEAPEFVWGAGKPGQRSAVDAPEGSPAARFLPVTETNLSEYLAGPWLRRSDCFCSPNVVPEEELSRYLGGVDEGGRYFRWTVRYSRQDLERILREKFFGQKSPAEAALGTLTDLRPLRRGHSGRLIELAVCYLDPTGGPRMETIVDQYRIREALHEKFLYSSAFEVRMDRDGNGLPSELMLTGAGWGHGAGLCQIGALGMALHGHEVEQIIQHYFAGVDVRTCYHART